MRGVFHHKSQMAVVVSDQCVPKLFSSSVCVELVQKQKTELKD